MIRRSTFIKISTQIAYLNYSLFISNSADKQKNRETKCKYWMIVQLRTRPSYSFLKTKMLKLRILYKYVMGFSDDDQILFETCLCSNEVNEQVLSYFYFFAIWKIFWTKIKKNDVFTDFLINNNNCHLTNDRTGVIFFVTYNKNYFSIFWFFKK